MKTYLFLFFLISCAEKVIEADHNSYFNSYIFEYESLISQLKIPVAIHFGHPNKNSDANAKVYENKIGCEIIIDKSVWNSKTLCLKKILLWHELSHCRGYDHVEEKIHIMNETTVIDNEYCNNNYYELIKGIK